MPEARPNLVHLVQVVASLSGGFRTNKQKLRVSTLRRLPTIELKPLLDSHSVSLCEVARLLQRQRSLQSHQERVQFQ